MLNASAHTTVANTAARRVVDRPNSVPPRRLANNDRSRPVRRAGSGLFRGEGLGRRRGDGDGDGAGLGSTTSSDLRREPWEREVAGVAGGVAQGLLDPQQLVVLGHPLAAGRRAGLDLAD